jgi:pimeloyl-ACP methyl ester carboxylesterase
VVAEDEKVNGANGAINHVSCRRVNANGHACRLMEKGEGEPVGYLGGFGGVPRWTPFLEALSRRRRVIVPSLPGFPGSPQGHKELDDLLDWLIVTRDLLCAAGLHGADLIATSVSGALAADAAAIWPDLIRRLILVSPFGLFDEADPTADLWAQRPGAIPGLLCARAERYIEFVEDPGKEDPLEWDIMLTRVSEAAIRYLYPFGDTGLHKRMHRISCSTLLLQGDADKVMSRSQMERLAQGIGPTCRFRVIAGAGHLAELDEPDAVLEAVASFLDGL